MPNIQTASADKTPIDDHLLTLGANLRVAREAAKLKQAEVASMADKLDRSGISKIERGTRAPNSDTLKRLCAALGVTQAHILRNIGPKGCRRRRLSNKERSTSTPGEIFGANLKWARNRAGMTQEALALDASLDFTTISRFEHGQGVPNTRTVLKLAHELKTTPSVLMNGT